MKLFKLKVLEFVLITTTCCIVFTACHARVERASCRMLRTLMPLLERSEKVDSCLTVLRGIDTMFLTRPADKARWSLLYAMALDKNYVDTTNLSILKPAIDHYTRWTHLNCLDKFYTWYYKARIEENAKAYDSSLDSYFHAERYMGATDNVYRTRLYFGMERVYAKTISYLKAFESAKKALYYARKTENTFNKENALCDCACCAVIFRDVASADKYLEEYSVVSHNDPYATVRPIFLRTKMVYFQYLASDYADSAEFYLNKYLEQTKGENIDYQACILTSLKIDDYKLANHLITEYEKECEKANDYPSVFYYCRYIIREKQGDYEGAFSDLKNEVSQVNRHYTFNLDKDIQSLELKYRNEVIKWRSLLIIVSLVSSILIILLIMMIELKKREFIYQSLKSEYENVRREYNGISSLFERQENSREDNISCIKGRIIDIARRFVVGRIENTTDAAKALSKRTSPDDVVTFVAYLTAVHCKKTFLSLKEKGLSIYEIGVCMLLLTDVRVNELEDILNKKSTYNVTRDIRAKLGAKGDPASIRHYLEKIYAIESSS